jgi:rubrerythrin
VLVDLQTYGSLCVLADRAMAEAAYKTTVLAAGKSQSTLTPGFEVLGLQREVAQRIWDEAAEEGFVTEREALYSGQRRKYDESGNRIDNKGELFDPENANIKKGASDDKAVSGVFECGQCGFTLFVATGRESKFYGSDFKCPECGAPKSKFNARDDFGEDE